MDEQRTTQGKPEDLEYLAMLRTFLNGHKLFRSRLKFKTAQVLVTGLLRPKRRGQSNDRKYSINKKRTDLEDLLVHRGLVHRWTAF